VISYHLGGEKKNIFIVDIKKRKKRFFYLGKKVHGGKEKDRKNCAE